MDYYDTGNIFNRFFTFLDELIEALYSQDVEDLMLYFFGCLPPLLQGFILFGVCCILILGIFNILKMIPKG